MKFYLTLFVCLFFSSCYEDYDCKEDYIGDFYIDTSLLRHSLQKKYISLFKWDTVRLVSKSNGEYYFNSTMKILKEAEGVWYISSKNIDGDCFGFVKQNNMNTYVNKNPFDILVVINDSIRFDLPFRKK